MQPLRDRARRAPVTAGYLAALVGAALLVHRVFRAQVAEQVHVSFSTSAHNLADHPVTALVGSAFLVDVAGGPVPLLLTLAGGIGWCLGAVERALGSRRAVTVAITGHVGAALVAALVVTAGGYPDGARTVLDHGAGHVAFAAAGAAAVLAPPVLGVPWLLGLVTCPLLLGDGFGALPGPGAVAATAAALIGAGVCWAVLARERRPVRADRVDAVRAHG
ncbi:rhomboid-like protein [Umezawaea beigongshangensis]|uniref:rhomboid-like protein n=1 Tax=Umezawaea beigongshangensis TaxID=2780383 RepID=UPI0027DB9C3B|nr:rhomboid-like protein [Umezawaea beigongshangensis]